jgi:hypothetical protein
MVPRIASYPRRPFFLRLSCAFFTAAARSWGASLQRLQMEYPRPPYALTYQVHPAARSWSHAFSGLVPGLDPLARQRPQRIE